jgi:hypothetical protein
LHGCFLPDFEYSGKTQKMHIHLLAAALAVFTLALAQGTSLLKLR